MDTAATHGPATHGPATTGTDLRALLRVVSARRWLIAVTVALVVGAVAALAFLATPYYRAKVRVLIERHNANATAIQEVYQLSTGTDDYYSTQHRILESRAVAEAALALLTPAERAFYERLPGRDPVDVFLRLRSVQPVPKSRLVDVAADHPDPAVAARAAEAVVTAYVQNGLQRLESASSRALDKLRRDAKELQEKLLAAERAVHDFKQRNEIIPTASRSSLTLARLEKLGEELAEIEAARSEAASRLEAVSAAVDAAHDGGDLPEVLDSPVVANCKRALLEARAERSQLAQHYKARHPRMLAIDGKVDATEAQLRAEVDAVHRGLRRQHERAVRREADVRGRLEAQKQALLQLESKTSQYALLVEEAEATRRLHDTVLGRLKEVQLIHGAETTNVHRIGAAETSPRPVRPDKPLYLLIALLGGTVLALGLAFAADLCDRTLKSDDEIGGVLGLAVFGTVPRAPGRPPADGALDPAVIDERSPLAEAFRSVRTNLAFGGRSRGLRTLVVTSAAPGDGKSVVAIHLAIAFARGGKRVLLVDSDLRRPRLHRAFAVESPEGLSSVLVGARSLGDVVRTTAVPGLDLLPCGLVPPNPIELLAGSGMAPALAAMREAYDLVLFDTPPAGVVSDACVLAASADQTLFVVRSCRTNRAHAARAVARLQATGANVTGAIANHADARARRYGDHDQVYEYAARDGREVTA